MRKIEQIQTEILTAKQADPQLSALNSGSKTAIWRLWVYVVSSAIFTLEKLFDVHQKEVSHALKQLKPHTARWYRNKALSFQYGYDLIEDSDRYDNSGVSDENLQLSKIIKYSAVTEAENESRLIVKIATEANGLLAPINENQKEAFSAYINEIKDAGVPVTIINYLPDILKLSIRIFRDALVLDAEGISRQNATKPVEIALQEFMKELPFNGELVLQSLANKLEQAEGVKIVQIDAAESSWINGDSYGNFQSINVRQVPASGYFQIENFNGISYVV